MVLRRAKRQVDYLYKLEGEPNGISIEQLCIKQGVPYQVFNKWFRSRKKRIVPVEIVGHDEERFQGTGREDGGPMLTISEMTDSEKNDFINFIYGQLKEREAQNEALHAKLDAQMDRFDKLQSTLDTISSQLDESKRMKEDLQKGFDNMRAQLEQMKNELVKTQKELRKSQREAKKYKELYGVLRDEKFVTKSQKSKQNKEKGRDDDKDDWDGTPESDSASSAVTVTESDTTPASAETESSSSESNAENQPEPRPYRLGKKYETMHADGTKKAYRCDRSLIPEGSKITKVEFRKRIHEEKRLVTVFCEYITYVDPDGKAHTKYFPIKDLAKAIIGQESKEELGLDDDVEMMEEAAPERFPGTHATIDNSEAERNIRTMTIERSNSKSFGSHEGVESSAVYHTIIATCKAQAISVCDYLKKFFMACVDGRTDYENLTPMMLCQPVK